MQASKRILLFHRRNGMSSVGEELLATNVGICFMSMFDLNGNKL
jgi:hypothetical protein